MSSLIGITTVRLVWTDKLSSHDESDTIVANNNTLFCNRNYVARVAEIAIIRVGTTLLKAYHMNCIILFTPTASKNF